MIQQNERSCIIRRNSLLILRQAAETGSAARHCGPLELGGVIQGHPGGQRVHVVAPAYDLSVLNSDNGDEPIVVRRARRKNLSVNLVFDDHNATIF